MSVKRYIQPETYPALIQALAEMVPGSALVAGGTDLMIEMKKKDPEIPVLVSLCRVPELKGIDVIGTDAGSVLRIGAMECHADIAASAPVRKYAAALAYACDHVGSRQVRNRGTAGGNLGNASVAGDVLPVLYLLHADLVITGADGRERTISAEDLQTGVGRTSLAFNEAIKEILIPVRPERQSLFVKLGAREEVTIAEISLGLSWEACCGKAAAVEGVLGAVDVRPIKLPEADEILGQGEIGEAQCEALAESLSERIAQVRRNRKRPPKLRFREGEREYKERAVKGVVWDAAERMKQAL